MTLRSRTLTARRLRRTATEVEQRLWRALRTTALPWKFRRQHPIGRYIVDFACPERRLVIEIDGGQHAARQEADERRSSALAGRGYRVIRFWNNEVSENLESVLETVGRALRSPSPHPDPLRAPGGGEGVETVRGLRIVGLRSALAGPFDLVVESGAVAISGPSGSGKSLFLRMIADLDPNEGEVTLDGRSRSAMASPAWRQRVVYNAAETGWWSEAVADHFAARSMDAARALAARIALAPELLEGPVGRLSSGEKLRLALIRALLLDPPVLLLDEPTGALDQDSTRLVERLLLDRMAAGTILLVSTHDPGQPRRLGARHLRMSAGQLAEAACTPSC